ncbi:hypothetical protein Poly24_42280 [Rosistilla carotiformis]|uniref:Uncharacterized protein n=1 Tax=Rosistilla carotiformis TaxID=2528017 RepID=A0A518JY91_9BACT|nr:hypothetical protein Poly24_42280 [Rosistilla carotiformis]
MRAGRRGVAQSGVATGIVAAVYLHTRGNLCRLLHWRPESDRAWLAREQSPSGEGARIYRLLRRRIAKRY